MEQNFQGSKKDEHCELQMHPIEEKRNIFLIQILANKRGYGGRWERSGGKAGEPFGELHSAVAGNEPSEGARKEETEEKQGSWRCYE